MKKTTCAHCAKDLATVEEIHAVEGNLYCSVECAIESQIDTVASTLTATAKKVLNDWYNDNAEIVTPQDIGLVYDRRWTAYSPEADVTTIFLTKSRDKEFDDIISTEVVGFYWGPPDEKNTELYTGTIKATY